MERIVAERESGPARPTAAVRLGYDVGVLIFYSSKLGCGWSAAITVIVSGLIVGLLWLAGWWPW